MPSSRRDPALLHNAICDNQGLICRGRCSHHPAGGSLLHMPLFIRLCVGNHPSPALPELPSRGAAAGFKAIPHNSKCRYGERGAADAKPKAQIILDAAKVSAASGGCSEPKQGQRSQSARGFCPRSTMRVPQPDIIEHFGNADAVSQPPERCLSRKVGIVRCCLKSIRNEK